MRNVGFNCGAKHDRDENAARNILVILVAGGHTQTKNGRVGKCKTTAASSGSQWNLNPHRS